ncbi:MAG: hypothetical protein ABIG20_05530 [archaeon]
MAKEKTTEEKAQDAYEAVYAVFGHEDMLGWPEDEFIAGITSAAGCVDNPEVMRRVVAKCKEIDLSKKHSRRKKRMRKILLERLEDLEAGGLTEEQDAESKRVYGNIHSTYVQFRKFNLRATALERETLNTIKESKDPKVVKRVLIAVSRIGRRGKSDRKWIIDTMEEVIAKYLKKLEGPDKREGSWAESVLEKMKSDCETMAIGNGDWSNYAKSVNGYVKSVTDLDELSRMLEQVKKFRLKGRYVGKARNVIVTAIENRMGELRAEFI